MNNSDRHYTASEITATAPFFLLPLLYGLAPQLTTPLACLCMLLACAAWMATGDSAPGWASSFALAAVSLSAMISLLLGNSYNGETGIGLCACLAYAFCLRERIKENAGMILRVSITAGAALASCLFLGNLMTFNQETRADLALRNPNAAALLAAMIFPQSWTLARQSEDFRLRWSFYALCVILLAGVILSGSTGTMGALAVGAAWLIPGRNKKWFMLGALAAGGAGGWFLTPELSWHNRWNWWSAAWKIFLEHPFLGAGFEGGFMSQYPLYKGAGATENTILIHNVYLEILSQWGLIGTLLIFAALKHLSASLRNKHNTAFQSSLLIAALAGFWDSSLLMLPNVLALLGLAAAALTEKITKSEPRAFWSRAPLWAALAFLIFGSFKLSISRVQLARSILWTEESLGRFREGEKLLYYSLRWDPKNPAVWADLARSEWFRSFGETPRKAYALRAQKEAIKLESKKSHWKNLKFIYSSFPQ